MAAGLVTSRQVVKWGFDSWSVTRVAIKWLLLNSMGDCLRTGKPFRYITNTKVNSAFHPFGVDNSSTGLSGWG